MQKALLSKRAGRFCTIIKAMTDNSEIHSKSVKKPSTYIGLFIALILSVSIGILFRGQILPILDGGELFIACIIPGHLITKCVWRKKHREQTVFDKEDAEKWHDTRASGFWLFSLTLLKLSVFFTLMAWLYVAYNHYVTDIDIPLLSIKEMAVFFIKISIFLFMVCCVAWWDNIDNENEWNRKRGKIRLPKENNPAFDNEQ